MKSGSLDIRHPRLLLRNILSPATPLLRLELAADSVSAFGGGIMRGGWNIDRPSSTARAADLPNQTPVRLPKLHTVAADTGYFSLLNI
jgi:hypothetical protein